MNNLYLQLFLTFCKIGAFTFGGGWAMISIIQREIVEKHKWIALDEFLDLILALRKCSCPIDIFLRDMSKVLDVLGDIDRWFDEEVTLFDDSALSHQYRTKFDDVVIFG